jgi:hypothetical protein
MRESISFLLLVLYLCCLVPVCHAQSRTDRDLIPENLITQAKAEVSADFKFEFAKSLMSAPECRQENPNDTTLFRDVIRSFSLSQYGEYVKLLARLQTRLMCFPPAGVRAYDLWMAKMLAESLLLPSMKQRQIVVQAFFNPAMLIFDQIQFTGNSAIFYVVNKGLREFQRSIHNYPSNRVELFLFGPASGRMLAVPGTTCVGTNCQPTVERLLEMFADGARFWPGWCRLAGVIDNGFRCHSATACAARSQYAMVGTVTSQYIAQLQLRAITESCGSGAGMKEAAYPSA